MVALPSRLDKHNNKEDDTDSGALPGATRQSLQRRALRPAQCGRGFVAEASSPGPAGLPEQLQGSLIETHRPPVSGRVAASQSQGPGGLEGRL